MQGVKEGYDVVVCDTSGRLHTNASLMDELAKCKRAIGKRLAQAPHETLLVLDGTTGQPCVCWQPCLQLVPASVSRSDGISVACVFHVCSP